MISTGPNSERFCTFHQYTLVWEVGTGLRVSLAPGEYRITAEERLDGVDYVRLEDTYRLNAASIVR